MNKAVIFDLDGVLLSTDHQHYLAWKKIADEEKIYFDENINNRLRGISRMDSLNIILERATRNYSTDEKEILAERKNNYYREELEALTPNYVSKDVLYTLEALRKKNIPLAIGSASKNTRVILQKTDLEQYFDIIVDGTMIHQGKPNPEVFLLGAKLLKRDPSQCVVVEDADAGIQAAKAGGFTAFGIATARSNPLTDHSINKLSDLLNYFE